MKQLILPLLLLGSLGAQAQANPLVNLVGAGTRMALGSSGGARQQKETLFVMPIAFGTHTITQKRTPITKLPRPGKGGTEIQAIEHFLDGRYAALQADSTALLLSVPLEKEFGRLRTNLEAFNSFWNTTPYSMEMSFYRQHDDIRRRLARQVAPH